MNYKVIILAVIAIFSIKSLLAQNKNLEVSGYISNMESVMFTEADEDWIIDNLIHNRLNFKYYTNKNFTFTLEMRNRFMFGQTMNLVNGYANLLETDNGLLNLSYNISSGKSYILNTSIDRANIMYEKGNLNIIVGRQRINWGQNYAWNPNDIFNSYSFFDFDYPEKPGADAIRIQYYTGMSSVVELAIKADNNDKITSAGLVRFNKYNYDFQLMGGLLNSSDIVLGMGWAGNLSSLGFRGEASYFKPFKDTDESEEMIVAGISLDYMFENSLNIQTEFLYSQNSGENIENILDYNTNDLSAKTMALSEYSIMASMSYGFSPLFSGTISGMIFPDSEGYYVGPSIDYSLTNNLSVSIFGQYFNMVSGENEIKLSMAFIRIKGNF